MTAKKDLTSEQRALVMDLASHLRHAAVLGTKMDCGTGSWASEGVVRFSCQLPIPAFEALHNFIMSTRGRR